MKEHYLVKIIFLKPVLITQTYENIGLDFKNYNPMSNYMFPLPTIRNVLMKPVNKLLTIFGYKNTFTVHGFESKFIVKGVRWFNKS